MDLSINCSRCGATNKFSEKNIPTFCSFCGAALPDMKPYVEEALKLAQERERREVEMYQERARHEMQMEKEDKEIRKTKMHTTVDMIKYILIAGFVGGWLYLIIRLLNRLDSFRH